MAHCAADRSGQAGRASASRTSGIRRDRHTVAPFVRCRRPAFPLLIVPRLHVDLTDDLPVFEDVFATNVTGVVATFAPFIGPMQAGAGPRRLVAIGSVAGVRGLKGAGAYCASKAAVASYCESLRLELKSSGIRVVTIAPGYIDTPMTRVNRFPMPFLMPADRFARAALRVIDAGPGCGSLDGNQLPPGKGGGLRNTRERLDVLYGEDGGFAVRNGERGIEVTLRLPFETRAGGE